MIPKIGSTEETSFIFILEATVTRTVQLVCLNKEFDPFTVSGEHWQKHVVLEGALADHWPLGAPSLASPSK